ncbi:MAG: peptidoglycan bridge formation glycyltransferase FemA/FemB family protein [bacterium]|nr:peptidoglycan bridge formation glycyltransferase FemA/FemB family protein [bacterium]
MSSFLQTEQWARFQEALGRRAYFISGENWKALLIRHALPLGQNYLYCPRGPAGLHPEFPISNFQFSNNAMRAIINEFLEKAAEVAKREKSIFLRWDPPFDKNFQFSIFNFQNPPIKYYKLKSVKSVQPQHTLIIDLTKTDDELLSGMHEKTRYNIRLAERKGVVIRAAGKEGNEIFWKLLQMTTERDAFTGHDKSHYERLSRVFSATDSKPFIRIYIAEYQNRPLAAAIIMFHNGTATYVHGASSNEYRNVMAPYLLHWRIMQDARSLDCNSYDLWGIDDRNPRWEGITRFKKGFGGMHISYPDSMDIIWRTWRYTAYRLAKSLR